MIDKIDLLITSSLFMDEEYARHVIPFIKKEYYGDDAARLIYNTYERLFNKYNQIPTYESVNVEINAASNIPESVVGQVREIISKLKTITKMPDTKFLIDKTEAWCREKATYNAVVEAISVIEGNHKTLKESALPDLFKDALAITFDTRIGHEYLPDAVTRYDYYHRKEEKISCDLTMINAVSDGGFTRKSLIMLMAGTGVGKSLAMCHFAASYIKKGHNVLYITLEMSEERIAERIDANLMDVRIQDIRKMNKSEFMGKVSKIENDVKGKLVIKEYPTSTANANHFRALLQDLKSKRDFKPDVIFVDYLNICSSSRAKMGSGISSYTVIKAIAEELRGLAVEHNCVLFSATQTTRSGNTSSDLELTDVSESIGVPQTTDFFIGLISNESLAESNKILVKQLKNRYGDIGTNNKFMLGIDRSKMRLFDVPPDETSYSNDSPVFDQSSFGRKQKLELNFN